MATKGKNRLFFQRPKANVVTIHSGKRLVMENVERIVFCQKEKIVLQGKLRLEICGKNLHLEELGNNNLAVCGAIGKVIFGEEEQ